MAGFWHGGSLLKLRDRNGEMSRQARSRLMHDDVGRPPSVRARSLDRSTPRFQRCPTIVQIAVCFCLHLTVSLHCPCVPCNRISPSMMLTWLPCLVTAFISLHPNPIALLVSLGTRSNRLSVSPGPRSARCHPLIIIIRPILLSYHDLMSRI